MALVFMGIPFCGDGFGIVCGTRLCGYAHLFLALISYVALVFVGMHTFFSGEGFVVTVWWRCVLFVPTVFGVAAL